MAIIFNKELRSRNKDNEKMILNGFANQRIGEKDFDYEQRRLHFVYDLAKSYIKELSSNIPNPNVIESSTFTSYEDAFDLMNAKKMNSRQNTRIREVENSLEELYFGKIIISEEEKDDNNELYIGKNIQRIKGNQYAVDWRAPISSLYYNKTQLVFTSLNQKKWRVKRRQTLSINHNSLLDLHEEYNNGMNTEKSISDPFLIQIVKNRKENDDIANIISSIQERQYKIITQPLNANFAVQGCAGSGKTMVMLHRISHILYNYPKLSPKSITILTPNDSFNTYISILNTELGINEINIFSIYEYYKHILNEYGIEISKKIMINPKEINPEIIERLYSSEMYAIYDSNFKKMKFDLEARLNRNEIKLILEKLNLPLFEIKFNVFDEFNKYKNQVKNSIEKLFNEYQSHVNLIESSLEIKLETYFINSLKYNLKYFNDQGIKYNKVLKSLNIIDNTDMLDLELNINNLLNLVKEDSDGLIGYLKNKYNLLQKYIQKSSDKTKSESSIETLKGNSNKIRKLIKFYQSVKYVSSNPGISIDEYKLFMRELESIDTLNDTQFYQSLKTEQSLDGCGINLNKNISYEYQVWLKLVSTYIYFGHKDIFSQSLICIDEVQDLSIFEIKLIRKIFGEQCSLNLYGDEKQNINNKGNYQLKSLINDKHIYLLNENYRNTFDITLYTNNQLSLNMIPIGVRGPLVHEIDMCEKQWVEDLALIIKDKFNKNHKKIVIAKDEEEVKSIQDKLITIENFSEFNFFTVREIKGMEYNTVIVFKQNMDDNELYISYTRSLNELIIIG